MSPQAPSGARRDRVDGPPSAGPSERPPAHHPSLREAELAQELAMSALVVVGVCVLLLAGVVVAYCSGKSAVCREFLQGAWSALR